MKLIKIEDNTSAEDLIIIWEKMLKKASKNYRKSIKNKVKEEIDFRERELQLVTDELNGIKEEIWQ